MTTVTATAYDRLTDAAGVMLEVLSRTAGHGARARVLYGLSALENAIAAVSDGTDVDDEGHTLARSTAASAYLLSQLAGVERAIAEGRPRIAEDHALDAAAAPVLDRIVAAGGMDEYLRDELYAAVEPIVGSQAAEVIACLPLGP